ncbi:histidine decarboxylase [Stylonychia lemnae]|uniref:Histidine decarboxylase n=1 Tax=Stylonychia lemnae TaxID=5949 RepID=A0A077ZW57_STYLE|nr:histidine decarboxylase [Stylonychia lemnae]|eukprot:CDW74185.1 histidine decarboxylase [Stylonychia lemnae]
MNIDEIEGRRLWLLAGHIKKLSYCNSLVTMLYNKNSSLDRLDTCFYHQNLDGSLNHKIIDSTSIGIIPGTLSDNFNFCYGDPSDPKVAWRNPHEREVIEIFGRLLGIEDISGYMTSCGSESNLASIWWSKLYLLMKSRPKISELKERLALLESNDLGSKDYKEIYETKKQLKRLYSPIVICTKTPHTHVSVIKACQALELKTLFIESNEDGSIDTQSLRGRLAEMKEHDYMNFIVSLNLGLQIGAAFDDVQEVRKVIEEVKNENWRYTVHGDAAMYGPTLPFLQQLGDKSNKIIECGLDTIAISLWKFLGVQVPCGVALSTRNFTDLAFEDDNFIEYVQMQDKVALSGTRSGIAAASALNVMKSLKMHEGFETLQKVIEYDMGLADYLCQQLELFFPKEQIKRKYLNVTFPRASLPDYFIDYYLLQRVGPTHLQSIVLLNVNKNLIDEFIEAMEYHLPLLSRETIEQQ